MPRIARIVFPGALYHIVHRGNNRQKIFHDEKDFRKYLDLLEKAVDEFGIILYAFGLMGTHLHLLPETPRGNISEFMKSVDLRYMQAYKKRHSLIGHLFQGRFKSIVIDKDNYLLEVSRYIHLQGVRDGIVKRPEEYPWTSYLDYIGKRRYSFIEIGPILGYFQGSDLKRSGEYCNFVNDIIDQGQDIKPPTTWGGIVYGSKNFGEKILKKIKGWEENRDTDLRKKREKAKAGVITFEQVIDEIVKFYRIYEPSVLIKSRDREYLSLRHQAMYLLRRVSNLSYRQIAEKFGYDNRSAVSNAVERLEVKLKGEKKLARRLIQLEHRLWQSQRS